MINITTPVGRIVQGELWKGNEKKDSRTGAVVLGADNQPIKSWFFALAIPKEPGHTHWAHTTWGRQIWDEGHKAHGAMADRPDFSWKIEDGDSVIPNKKNKKNCDREGHRGHWILKFSSYYPIDNTWDAKGDNRMAPEAFKTGHYAQVFAQVKGNTGDTPGLYLNPVMVALSGYGTLISSGPDVSEAGFGAAPLPAGASMTPPAGMSPHPGAAPALPMPGASVPPAVPSLPVPGALPAAPSPLPVLPNPAILAGPGGVPQLPPLPTPPAPLPVPPAAPVYTMTAAANGYTRDQLIAQGWTDAALRAQGLML